MDSELNMPQPEEISSRERERSLASYFMMFISSTIGLPLPFINLIASWIYYAYTKRTSSFVKFHSLQSLISQIPVTLLNTSLVIWIATVVFSNFHQFKDALFTSSFFGFVATVIAVNLVYIIFSIIAAVRAFNGRLYYFPFFGNIAYKEAFLKQHDVQKKVFVNKPPQL